MIKVQHHHQINQGNAMNDKEKTKEALELLNKLIEHNEKKHKDWLMAENFLISTIYTKEIEGLEAIKKTLES